MTKKVQAYILIEIEIGRTDEVVSQLKAIEEATRVAVTTGVYDVVVLVEVDDLEALYDITVHRIHSIPGIMTTSTAVVEKMIST
ncbi:MAG: Lrp/AsnC ligand binding domain-containing protein [Promethearchaeota archaeon]